MKNTQTDQKASAPETRIDEWCESIKDAPPDNYPWMQDKRTIPAEKPTAMLESIGYWKGYKAAQAQAAQLAEALRACLDVMERVHGVTLPVHLGAYCEEQDWSFAVRNARSQVAAYEAAR